MRHIAITARRFEFDPATLELEPGVPVILELRALDRVHGFSLPDLGIEARLEPGAVVEVPLTPTRPGRFAFHCHIFCGSGHEEMTGVLVVREPKR